MYASEIADYLEHLADKLGELGGVFREGPVIEVDYSDSIGILDVRIAFEDGSELDVAVTSAGPSNYPEWLDYTFHLMDSAGVCVFRYDNAPHHMGAFFPDHKHVGAKEEVEDRPRPTFSEILEEVRQRLYGD